MQCEQILQNIDWWAFVPMLVAVILGGVIGLERELHRKAAGLRTNILICMGAALFVLVARGFQDENAATRIIQGVITGVGFIGAGALIHSQLNVHGLTTAATIWLVTGIGVACGMRLYEIAVGATVLALIILVALNPLDKKINRPQSDDDLD